MPDLVQALAEEEGSITFLCVSVNANSGGGGGFGAAGSSTTATRSQHLNTFVNANDVFLDEPTKTDFTNKKENLETEDVPQEPRYEELATAGSQEPAKTWKRRDCGKPEEIGTAVVSSCV
jgi:hypothetical protein